MDFEHERRLTSVEAMAQANKDSIDEIKARQDNIEALATSVATLAAREEQVEKDVKEIKVDVKSIASKPGKRWDAIVDKVIWAVLAAFIAFLLGRAGL